LIRAPKPRKNNFKKQWGGLSQSALDFLFDFSLLSAFQDLAFRESPTDEKEKLEAKEGDGFAFGVRAAKNASRAGRAGDGVGDGVGDGRGVGESILLSETTGLEEEDGVVFSTWGVKPSQGCASTSSVR